MNYVPFFLFLFCYNAIHSAPGNQLTRVECVVREYPPQTTTPGVGYDMVTIITQSQEFLAEMIVQSGERERERERGKKRKRERERERESLNG